MMSTVVYIQCFSMIRIHGQVGGHIVAYDDYDYDDDDAGDILANKTWPQQHLRHRAAKTVQEIANQQVPPP